MVDTLGLPLHVELTPGQQHEASVADGLLAHVQGQACIADTAYDSGAIRQKLADKHIQAVIPCNPSRSSKIPYDKDLYKERHLVEVFFNRIKHFRRVATRYEKTARNFLAVLHLACIKLWLL